MPNRNDLKNHQILEKCAVEMCKLIQRNQLIENTHGAKLLNSSFKPETKSSKLPKVKRTNR